MYYCPFCGGKLPDSLREQYFTEFIESEVSEVRELIKKIDSLDKMRNLLGEPDEIYYWDPVDEHTFKLANVNKWVCTFEYNKRWKSLILSFQELENGTLGISYHGRYIGKKNS